MAALEAARTAFRDSRAPAAGGCDQSRPPSRSGPGGIPAGLAEQWIVQESHGGQRRPILSGDRNSWAIYKPRSLAIDVAWDGLVQWFGSAIGERLSVPLAVTQTGTSGWMQLISPRPCCRSEVDRYYARLGKIGALLWLIGGSDGTASNMIAAGATPTLIDAEMSLTAGTVIFDDPLREFRRCGIGPIAAPDQQGRLISLGAAPTRRAQCRHGLRLADQATFCPLCHHVPCSSDRTAGYFVETCIGAIASGFADGLSLLLERKSELLGASSPLAAFEGSFGRVTMRSTASYVAAQNWAFQELRANGQFPDIAGLFRKLPCKHPMSASEADQLIVDEVATLKQGDIPRFEIEASATAFKFRNHRSIALGLSGLDRARERLKAFDRHRMEAINRAWRFYLSTIGLTSPPLGS